MKNSLINTLQNILLVVYLDHCHINKMFTNNIEYVFSSNSVQQTNMP